MATETQNITFLEQSLKTVIETIKDKFPVLSFWNEFIKSLKIDCVNNNTIYILTKNLFAQQIIAKEYSSLIKSKLNSILNANFDVCFVVEKTKQKNTPPVTTPVLPSNTKLKLNKSYTFNNFVINQYNKMCYEACVSFHTNDKWNPLFIYGDVGLGKTHLMHAIGNDFAKNSPNKMVIFVSSDDFVREIYSALTAKNNEIETIKNKYQSCDLLLIDDVQFFAKKEKINEIFFNILNYKISHNQFVVMTSDKHPTLLNDFENRMISRFNSGLCVKIHKHDLGSLKNILLQKIKNNDDGYVFTQDSIDYITRRCQNDVRKLEGLLNTILFFITNNLPPKSIVTLQNIKNILGDEEKELKKMYGTDPEFVVDYICDLYHTEVDEIKSKKKTKHLSMVRHVCMYVLKEKYGLSLSSIGSCLGGRDHTTVIEGVKKIKYLIQKDAELNSFLNNIVKKI